MTTFCKLSDYASAEEIRREVVVLISEAGNPYYDWFYGGGAETRAAIERQLDRPDSELARDRVTVLLRDARLGGLYVALGGAELARVRLADTVALVRAGSSDDRQRLRDRLNASRELFPALEETDYYLSKIAVTEGSRGTGLGRALLDEYLAEGRRNGFRRFCLDVSAANAAAIMLYRAAGFTVAGRSENADLAYLRMSLDSTTN